MEQARAVVNGKPGSQDNILGNRGQKNPLSWAIYGKGIGYRGNVMALSLSCHVVIP